MRTVRILSAVILSLLTMAAAAVPITLEYDFGVFKLYDPSGALSGSDVALASMGTASITYENSTPDSLPGDDQRGDYQNAIVGLTFTVGEFSLQYDPLAANSVGLKNVGDYYSVFSYKADVLPLLGATQVQLGAAADLIPLTDKLTDMDFAPPRIDSAVGSVYGWDESGGLLFSFLFSFDGNYRVASAVPEPASITLLGLGLVGVIAASAGRRRGHGRRN